MKNLLPKMHLSLFFVLGFLFYPLFLSAQKTVSTGRIIDAETNETLVGVTVVEKGTTNGTITDIDGNFSITTPDKSDLVISYVGYKTKTVQAQAKMGDISMTQNQHGLDEVVVVGYGTQKKSVVTAAISQVKGDQLVDGNPLRVEDALKGKVSGVNITQASGQPGDQSTVRIRGAGSINNSDPLYIVDGMPINGGIDYLNPSDIASVEVLKDAASAAIYGARAANGVILVTTKSGKSGKTTLSYDFSYGWQNAWKKIGMLNATQYETLMNEMYTNSGQPTPYAHPASAGIGTNWQNEIFDANAPVVNNQVSASGGNDKGSYFLGFGNIKQDGIVGGNFGRSNYERWNLRLNNNYTLIDNTKDRSFLNKLRVGANLSYSHIIATNVSANNELGSPLGNALLMSPDVPLYATDPNAVLSAHPNAVSSPDGRVYSIAPDGFNEITNPIAGLSLPGTVYNSDKFVSSFWAELDVIKGLKFKTSYGTDLAFWGNDGWTPPYYLGITNYSDNSSVATEKDRGFTWQIENTLTYDKAFGKDHHFNFLLGQSAQSTDNSTLWGKSFGMIRYGDNYANINATTAPIGTQLATGGVTQHRLVSYFGRIDYNYKERYMLEASLRDDASTNFGPNNRWGKFPSVSGGWVASSESFMKPVTKTMNFLKLRASWGVNGNEAIPPFAYEPMMQAGNNYIFGNAANENTQTGVKPSGLYNPSLRWEQSTQTDFGLDAYFFKSALTFTFDWFKKRTSGMLMQMPLPDYVGDSAPYANVGTMDNTGFEVEVGYKFHVAGIQFNMNGNMSYIKNNLVNLGNDTGYQNWDGFQSVGAITRAENGHPFPYFYGYKTDGIFQNQGEIDNYKNKTGVVIQPNAKPGDVKFVDLNGDGKIDANDETQIGKGMPDITYGLTIGANWKGFDLNAFFQGVEGVNIYDITRRIDLANVNLPSYMLDRWHGEGTSNSTPRLLISSDNNNWQSSDLYVQNGNYLRLKNLQIGYTLPKSLTQKIDLEKLRFYIQGENLLTFTSYRGFDPEVGSSGSNSGSNTGVPTSMGIDRGIYPQARTLSIGANITF